MKITIIGWYGTETIGDRAILAGIFSFIARSYENFEILLGSLNPFFTQRTIDEDKSFWKDITQRDIQLKVFNSTRPGELKRSIKLSDMVIMGGGPLMHLDELIMVEYAFSRARRRGVKTIIMGCGIGPLFYNEHQQTVLRIIQQSDIVILRDEQSKQNLVDIFKKFQTSISLDRIHVSLDPAVECALQFSKKFPALQKSYIALNIRQFPEEYSRENISERVNAILKSFVSDIAKQYSDRDIILVPMHYFHIGNDDRQFLNVLKMDTSYENIKVQNKNLSLFETLRMYQCAHLNIGMRFHSVVLQTLVSGRNIILDYTEPQKGKIYGFIKDIDNFEFYQDKYFVLQKIMAIDNIAELHECFNFDLSKISERLSVYLNAF
ncbi:Polysaccharide pyruvyl transferase [Candidatus Magnetomorum sp. HK-1]|nr:Polysaccharide pyruvyl transferase [Candidatus Magnetomorum sp. HK-1]